MRKLAITAFAFSLAVFCAHYLLPLSALLWLAAALALLGALLLTRKQKWLLGLILAAFGLAAGFLCYFVHAQGTILKAVNLDGETCEIRGRLLGYVQNYDGYSRVELSLEGDGLPHLNALLYADSDAFADAKPGDRITCTAKLRRADQRYGENYDRYLSRDVYLIANARTDLEICPVSVDLRTLPVVVSHLLAERVDLLFPEDTAPFMKSLMRGDRSDFYQDEGLYLAMSRSGFMHIVAVSGMHVAFLVGLIQLLLGRTRRSSILCLILVWFFVLVAGSSPSAVRAAVMQSFLLTAPLFQRENDPVTSLSAALALILVFNPFACASVSLQLSFAAMAGFLCFAEPLTASSSGLFSEAWAERLRAPIATAASSLAVMVFTVPLSVLHFGSISILSPLTNILGLWAVSFCFCGGYLSCLLGVVLLPLGKLAAWLTAWLVRYLVLIAHGVSSISFATIYVKGALPVIWVILVYLLAACAAFSKLGTVKKIILPLALSCLSLALMLGATRQNYRSGLGVISVIDVGQGQCIAVMSGDRTVVIDCGGIYSSKNAGEQAGSYLLACGRDHVDVLILTHLHADHCNGVSMLLEMLPVEQLIMPRDVPDDDGLRDTIVASAEKHGTTIVYLSEDSELNCGEIHGELYAPGEQGNANERCLMACVSLGDYDMLVTGDSSKSQEQELLERHPLSDLELLIVGHHGSRYASSGELLGTIGADTAVISVGYNTYGHPTYETLERLRAYGYNIYRTDLNGTVEIRLRNKDG